MRLKLRQVITLLLINQVLPASSSVRLHICKGQDEAIRALAEVVRRGIDMELLFVGAGSKRYRKVLVSKFGFWSGTASQIYRICGKSPTLYSNGGRCADLLLAGKLSDEQRWKPCFWVSQLSLQPIAAVLPN